VETTKLLLWDGPALGRAIGSGCGSGLCGTSMGSRRRRLQGLLRSGSEVKFKFKEYNWDVNGK